MNDESIETLVECPTCASTDFCVIKEDAPFCRTYIKVTCRLCNKLLGLIDRTTLKENS